MRSGPLSVTFSETIRHFIEFGENGYSSGDVCDGDVEKECGLTFDENHTLPSTSSPFHTGEVMFVCMFMGARH